MLPSGGTEQSFIQGGSAPRSNPLPFYFCQKKYSFRISSIDKWHPFHIPCLELCIPRYMYEYICLLHTAFSKALWWAVSEPKRRKRETTSEKHEKGMMGTNAEREQRVKPGKKKREVRVRVNTQEVEWNTGLRLVFPLTLLSCSSPPPACLQQNRAQSKFLYLLIFTYFVRKFCERFFCSRLPT